MTMESRRGLKRQELGANACLQIARLQQLRLTRDRMSHEQVDAEYLGARGGILDMSSVHVTSVHVHTPEPCV